MWPDLERLRVRTLLAWGDADLYSPPSVQRMLAAHLPRVETLVVNESGHAPQWERPDIFNPALLNFFRKTPHQPATSAPVESLAQTPGGSAPNLEVPAASPDHHPRPGCADPP
ncbi:hypothetical protein Ssi03_34060 [Sphaerisporangium siamense]|uniref:AB hydrolase-1 domain-containing protein n=1 Tax=Sphaerisporangium siamense TaxID=795645 RepID=A0A7W7D3X7_9ACTN|nr:alpha/beta hydrolase [Sphaerisporangium siamense]MBB4698523.1 hypothetical protein [Sphaerisporangium siamense]GII85416.1 hypothetical protein Ssi03_34060 [Sphaerisporangium siamense]